MCCRRAGIADAVVIGPVSARSCSRKLIAFRRVHRRITPPRGRPAKAFDSSAEIADYLAENARPGDLVMVDVQRQLRLALCAKLLDKLQALSGAVLSGTSSNQVLRLSAVILCSDLFFPLGLFMQRSGIRFIWTIRRSTTSP